MSIQKQIIHGSGLSISFRLLQVIVQFMTSIVIINLLLPEDLGMYKWIVAFSSYGILAGSLGMDEIVAKYSVNFSESNDLSKKVRLIRDAYIIRNVACVLVFIFLYLLILPYFIRNSSFSEVANLGIKIGVIFGISSIFSSNIQLSIRLLDAEFLFVKGRLLDFLHILVPSFIKVVLTYTSGIYGLALGTLIGAFLTFLITEYLTKKDIFDKYRGIKLHNQKLWRLILGETFFLAPVLFVSLMYSNIDLIIVGFLLPTKDVGYYGFSKMIIGIIISILTFASPMVYPFLIKKQIEGKEKYYIEKILKYTFSLNFFVVGMVIVLSKPIIQILFPNYISAYPIMLILLILPLLQPFSFYIVGPIINQHRLYKWQAKIMLLMLIPLIILNYLFILKIGVIGAAIGTAICVVFLQIIMVKKSLQVVSVTFLPKYIWKPFASMAISTAICYPITDSNLWYFALPFGGILYPIIYLMMLSKVLLSFDDDDKKFVHKLLSNAPKPISKIVLTLIN